ncbi:MAG: gamma-glutamyltransferase [Acidimicrobiales bacterium]
MTRRATRGMVSSVDYLASEAGVATLRAGGNAVDAAVTTSAVLAVTAPHLCGMGGDLFALVSVPGDHTPLALNASGRAGGGADPERLRAEGHSLMPFRDDLRSAPVPGCVDGWLALHTRFGKLPIATVLEAAIGYAEDGFPASPLLAGSAATLTGVAGCPELNDPPIKSGHIVRRRGVASAIRAVVDHGRDGFYKGDFGESLIEMGKGEYAGDDMDRNLADWVEPLKARAWGHDLWTVPPNSQGYLAILGSLIAEGLPLPSDSDDPLWAHFLIESARVAAFDRTDRLFENADVRPLFDETEVEKRRHLIDPDRRSKLGSASKQGDTMYMCAVDGQGIGVSLIQSNASGFGCLVFEPKTGIGLHNRGIGFSLVAGHPAEYGPRRRPPHTLAPMIVTRPDGTLRGVIGTMGGDAQPQILLQLLTRWLHHGRSAGEVISAGRFTLSGSAHSGFDTWTDPDGVRVELEADGPVAWPDGLVERGHRVNVVHGVSGSFGHSHLIEVGPDPVDPSTRVLGGAADPRALVGAVAAY